MLRFPRCFAIILLNSSSDVERASVGSKCDKVCTVVRSGYFNLCVNRLLHVTQDNFGIELSIQSGTATESELATVWLKRIFPVPFWLRGGRCGIGKRRRFGLFPLPATTRLPLRTIHRAVRSAWILFEAAVVAHLEQLWQLSRTLLPFLLGLQPLRAKQDPNYSQQAPFAIFHPSRSSVASDLHPCVRYSNPWTGALRHTRARSAQRGTAGCSYTSLGVSI